MSAENRRIRLPSPYNAGMGKFRLTPRQTVNDMLVEVLIDQK